MTDVAWTRAEQAHHEDIMRGELKELRAEIRSMRDVIMRSVGALAVLILLASVLAPFAQRAIGAPL